MAAAQIISALGAAAPYIAQGLSGLGQLATAITQSGSMSGSSSNAQSQSSQSSGATSGGESSQSTSVQQGNPAGIAGAYQTAMSTPTGNTSQWAAGFNAQQAQTANNLQMGQWTLANAMNQFGNIMSNLGNLWGATSARAYNENQAEIARNWQEKMRKTAYQDTVADMKAAGINPILAASRGATETPGTGAASTSNAQFQQMTSAAIPSAHAAVAQSMYDYGNNTAQFLNNAVAAINNAKLVGMTDTARQFAQSTSQIVDSSAKSIDEYTSKTDSQSQKDIKDAVKDTAKDIIDIPKKAWDSYKDLGIVPMP